MSEQKRSLIMSRRRFLAAAGLAAGSLALTRLPVLSTIRTDSGSASLQRPVTLGVLLPQSRVYPALGESFLDGMRLHLAGAGAGDGDGMIRLIAEPVGVGAGPVVAGTRRLIEEERVDLVVGVVNAAVTPLLSGLLAVHNAVFIAADAGANAVRSTELSPAVFHNSSGYWQANWAIGAWAAENLGRSAFIAASLYESGYDALYAFRRGFEGSGGQLVGCCVTHVRPDATDVASTIAAIRNARPDFVYALYSGPEAVEFVRAYADAGLAARIPLAGSGFMVDEAVLPRLGSAAMGIKSCLPWAPGLETPENQAFATAYAQKHGRAADIHAVLGYDTARLAVEAMKSIVGDASRSDRLAAALGGAQLASPRGRLTMSAETHSASTPLYLREVRRRGGALINEVIGELAQVAEIDRQAAPAWTGLRSGWLNAYLSV